MFFISFGRAWAQNIKPEAAVARVRTDPHSPNKYRVDGTVYNIPEFAKAFKCSPKAKVRQLSTSTSAPVRADLCPAQPSTGEALPILVKTGSLAGISWNTTYACHESFCPLSSLPDDAYQR
jgi:hypothetical protein